MSDNLNPGKVPPRKYHPKGLSIIYEDRDIIVVDKVSGLLTVSTDREKEKTAYFLLTDYVKRGNSKSKHRIFIVHRLDRDTSGLIVFAKSESAKHFLQDNWASFRKKYFVVVNGRLNEQEGMIESYLAENKAHKMYSTKNQESGKLAKTGYRVLETSRKFSLLEIDLLTGRKNQIRVHFSEKGFPVAGDSKYNEQKDGVKRLALHSSSLTILHPFSKKEMIFQSEVPAYFKELLR